MKLPSTIRIGHMDYVLEVCDKGAISGGKAAGEFDADGGLIRIERNEPAVMCHSLMHECEHGILAHSGLDQILDAKFAESLCNALPYGWLQIFRDNPWLLAYLKKAVES